MMKRSLGPQESLFFALMQMRDQRTVRTGELIGPMGITSHQEEELLRRLARGRLIVRVRRGLYLVPSRELMTGFGTSSLRNVSSRANL
jgi:hypothetical protein